MLHVNLVVRFSLIIRLICQMNIYSIRLVNEVQTKESCLMCCSILLANVYFSELGYWSPLSSLQFATVDHVQ